MSITRPISNYDEFIQLRKKLKKHKRNSINENITNITNEKFITTCIENSSFKKISNNLNLYQKFYFNFYNSNDKKIYSDIDENNTKDTYNHKLDKINNKLDNFISINNEEEIDIKKDILIKENQKSNNVNNKKNLSDEEKLEEIFKNKVMINIVG